MLIVHKFVNNIAPIYISELLNVFTPSRNLRSSNMSLLKEPTSKRTWARFHETLQRIVAQDTMRCKNDFTKLTMRSMHRKLLDNYAEHVAIYDDRYSRLGMRRVNLIIRKCVQNGVLQITKLAELSVSVSEERDCSETGQAPSTVSPIVKSSQDIDSTGRI